MRKRKAEGKAAGPEYRYETAEGEIIQRKISQMNGRSKYSRLQNQQTAQKYRIESRGWRADKILGLEPPDWGFVYNNLVSQRSWQCKLTTVRWSIYIVNSVDKPNFRVSLPHRRSTTVSLETNPLYSFVYNNCYGLRQSTLQSILEARRNGRKLVISGCPECAKS